MKASRFLLKDDLEQTLSECVEDILREERVVEFGFVEGNVRLRVDDIIYIETNKHKNVFCTVGRHTASIRRWMSIFKKVIIFSLVAVGHIVDTHIIGEGSAVTLPQNNFCGLGVTQRGKMGLSFETPQLGIRAQVQHLKAYASTDKLRNERIDPRFRYVTRGCAPYVEWLGQIHTMAQKVCCELMS